jgi:hypothetical protein
MGKVFASSGIVVGQTPRSKRDQKTDQLKGNKVTMGRNVPRQTEGAVGDITVRDVTSVGLRCYIKTNSGWFDINSLIATFRINWIDMNLINGWATDATYGTPQYCKDQNGFVHLRGGVDSGNTVTDDIVTLPKGHRPQFEQRRLVSRVLNANIYIQQIRITSGGVIRRVFGSIINLDDSVDADTTKEVCLDGISFYAHQKVTSIGAGSTVSQEQFPSGYPVL